MTELLCYDLTNIPARYHGTADADGKRPTREEPGGGPNKYNKGVAETLWLYPCSSYYDLLFDTIIYY